MTSQDDTLALLRAPPHARKDGDPRVDPNILIAWGTAAAAGVG